MHMRSHKQKELLGVISLKSHKAFQNHPLFTYATRKENWLRKAEGSQVWQCPLITTVLGIVRSVTGTGSSIIHILKSSQICQELHMFPNYHLNIVPTD